jgi:hypothetical protein
MSQNFTVGVQPGDAETNDLGREVGGYRIVQGEHGDLVFGQIPIRDLEGLNAMWSTKGYTVMDFQIASALDATLAVTSPEAGKLWREEIEVAAKRLAKNLRADPPEEAEWAWGLDTGTSSMTIMLCLGTNETARQRIYAACWQRGAASLGSPPSDPDDLGRCIRLLDKFPAWRERLGEVAAKYPAWAPLVSHWRELEALYREELPEHAGRAPRLLARMRGLLEGPEEARVDLSGLDGDQETRGGPYFEALDGVLDALIDRHEDLPAKLYVTIPGEATTLLWDRDGEEPSVETALRTAQARVDAQAGAEEEERHG